MTSLNPIAGLTSLAVCALVTACNHPSQDANTALNSAPKAKTTKSVAAESEIPHGKQTASVTFSHAATKTVDVGENGSINLTITEAYASGTLMLEASGDEGLNVFGAEATRRLDMTGGASHSWRIDFQAESEGIHYINILAIADLNGRLSESRAHSIRVNVGDWEAAEAKLVGPQMEQLDEGEMAVIMEAEETIE